MVVNNIVKMFEVEMEVVGVESDMLQMFFVLVGVQFVGDEFE